MRIKAGVLALLLAFGIGPVHAQTSPGLLGPGQVVGNFAAGTGLATPVNPTAAATACPSWLSNYQLFANTTGAPASIPLQVWDGTACVTMGTLNATTHAFNAAIVGGALYSEFASYQSNPILSPTGTENITSFGSALKVGSTYYYYYMYSPNGTAAYVIGRATSPDGVTWTKDVANNPVFTKAVSGWDAGQVGVPNVWVEGSTWYMLYRGGVGLSGPFRGGLATSSDGITWTRAAVNNCAATTGNGCVLDLGNVSGGTEDMEFFGVIKVGSIYYAGIDNPGGAGRASGIATSTDLSTWTKNASNPLYTAGRYCTNIIKLGDFYYQFVVHYIGGGTTYAEIELYRNSTPVFLPATRTYLGLAVTQSGTNLATDGTNWDAFALDTPWVLTDDITRSSFAASNGDLWMYYAGSSTAAHTNYYTGLAIAGQAASLNQTNAGFFPKAVTTPGQLTVGAGATIVGNVAMSSTLTVTGGISSTAGNLAINGSATIGAGLSITNTSMSLASASFGLSGNISGNGIFGTNGIRYKNVGATLNDPAATGTIATNYDNIWGGNSLVAGAATTITNEFGSYFKDPIASTNVTFTNKYSIGADSAKINGPLTATGAVTSFSGTAIPAGGTAGNGFLFSSTANFGVFFGSGAPTLSAAKGSIYLRSDGAINARMYINTDGGTTWTAFNTTS